LADQQGNKTGGRKAGTPNKATREVRAFLERVFKRAFSETRLRAWGPDNAPREVGLEDVLVEQILNQSIDNKLFISLLTFYAGRPTQAVDHTHQGKVTLEQMIAGTVPATDPTGDDE
jgi:BioD-like phosphotransacetylase family protein